MREILFRGKSRDTNKWVFGSFVSDACGISREEYLNEYGDIGLIMTYVIPETVGQYTGLTDKNGKKIFEGDIVKFCDIKGVINYSMGCYCVKTNKPDWKSRNNPAIDIVLNEYENEIEILGNMHDNPELLKGGVDNG